MELRISTYTRQAPTVLSSYLTSDWSYMEQPREDKITNDMYLLLSYEYFKTTSGYLEGLLRATDPHGSVHI